MLICSFDFGNVLHMNHI